VSIRDIPYNELCDYLAADLHATQQLSDKLNVYLNSEVGSGLMDTVLLTNCVCKTLTRIYCNGFKVDRAALEEVTEQFTAEKEQIEAELQRDIKELMGDTPINLNSPEQLSQVIFSRKLKDKKTWPDRFDQFMPIGLFRQTVNAHTSIVSKIGPSYLNPLSHNHARSCAALWQISTVASSKSICTRSKYSP